MDDREYFRRLETTAETPSELFEHFETRTVEGRAYHALPDARHGVERGTVVFEDADAIVRGYPSVPRVLVLDSGVTAAFDGDDRIAVEEKLDGFNVRIAAVDEPLAFTLGGYVCPYTTGRARTLLPLSEFFGDHPEKMLCAELVGPETPYTTHDYDDIDSHAFRVFGVRDRETGEPLPVAPRRELCEAYGLEQPSFFGWHSPETAVDGVREAIDSLDSAGREGVVMKSADSTSMVKYTTEAQHHADLAYAFSLPFDYGRDFVFSRIVRDAFQAAEFAERDGELRRRAHDLGESILLPMVETIRRVEAGETVGEQRTVRGESRHVDALLGHLHDQSLTLTVDADYRDDGNRVVEFTKVAESTRDTIRHYLDGGSRDE